MAWEAEEREERREERASEQARFDRTLLLSILSGKKIDESHIQQLK